MPPDINVVIIIIILIVIISLQNNKIKELKDKNKRKP